MRCGEGNVLSYSQWRGEEGSYGAVEDLDGGGEGRGVVTRGGR